MKITRQGVLDLNLRQTNGKLKPLHPLEIQELDLQARSFDYDPELHGEELPDDMLSDYLYPPHG